MYLGFQSLRWLARVLPFGLTRAVGQAAGWLAYVVLPGQRRLISDHLAYAFGSQFPVAERRRIARGIFQTLGLNAAEWLVFGRMSKEQIRALVEAEGLEHLRDALRQGNGGIMVTAHFGNWELLPIYLLAAGFQGGVLARRLRYPEYESILIAMRGAHGVPTYARGAIKEVAKVLRANQLIGLLPDQDIDSLDGVFVNFFGHPAYTPVGPAALSIMTGAPIIPCFIVREGRRFRITVEPPLRAVQGMDRTAAMAALTQAWSDAVEAQIRKRPDHWMWMHRRWKTQPGAAPAVVQAPAPPQPGTAPGPAQPSLAVALFACALALASAAGCSKPAAPSGKPPGAAQAPPANPDATQQMSGFTLTGYGQDGSKRWELHGTGATVEDQIVTIHKPDAVGYDPERMAYVTASAAQVNQTNRHVRLEHDVAIHTQDGLWLFAPVLHWIPDENRVATDTPVRLETDHMLVRGIGATGQTQLKQATILKDVTMVLNPSDNGLREGQQVTITCDGPLTFDYNTNVATFEQNVHVQDPNGDLYSDKLVAYLDPKTRTIRYAEAFGKVRIHQEQNTALSERAVYEPGIGKITLVGKPSLLVYPDGSTSPAVAIGGLGADKKTKKR